MLMADECSNFWPEQAYREEADDEFTAMADDLSMDLTTFYAILGEDCEPSKGSPEESLLKNVSTGVLAPEVGSHKNSPLQNGSMVLEEVPLSGADLTGPVAFYSSYSSEASDSGTKLSCGLSDLSGKSVLDSEYGKLEPSSQTCSPVNAFLDSCEDWFSLFQSNETCCQERTGVSHQCDIPTHSMESTFTEVDVNHIAGHGDNLYPSSLKNEKENKLKHVGEHIDFEYASNSRTIGIVDVNFSNHGASEEETIEEASGQGRQEITSPTFMDADRSPLLASSTDSTICQGSNVSSDCGEYYSSIQYCKDADDILFVTEPSFSYLPNGSNSQFFPILTNMKDEKAIFTTTACASSKKNSNASGGITFQSASEVSPIDFSDAEGWNFNCQGSKYMQPNGEYSSLVAGNFLSEDKSSIRSQPYMSSKEKAHCIKDEINEPNTPYQNSSHSAGAKFYVDQKIGFSTSNPCERYNQLKHENKDMVITSNRADHHQDTSFSCNTSTRNFNLKSSEQYLPHVQPSILSMKLDCIKNERDGKMIKLDSVGSHLSKLSTETIHSNILEKSVVEDDFDVCIIEDINQTAPSNRCAVPGNSLSKYPFSTHSDFCSHTMESTRLKANDERNILLVALQDLSQPKSEVSPPDGLLAVPLLRHQRIALSWMVQKETASLNCSGGILADDQGLGKTVSTIALILKERSPSLGSCQNVKISESETLNLDEDDVVLLEHVKTKQDPSICQEMSSEQPMKSVNSFVQAKGRPSAGTLIVCPTSVLRQWAEELHNKVTSKANLSVLVYHGSNRTKDPYELSKYDVVLTTYSIVSMEVPKQPLVDKDEDEKGNYEDRDVRPMGLPPSRKRKCPPNSGEKCKGLESGLLESVARPLAKVAWFRVVLDEAQSIKNHRAQVARACWGLRAKRRWCLSGTPIQNAIDDLYSYFRFLRYDPYAVYTIFCSTIKVPINRNPTEGYKKLQAVLKTIMLRRTKGTLLDGDPIITLPPKFVELKKVDFSREEREFYSRLEADSRAQFQEYADAGTVKQNYVNILLMLLRLRQACDHPLLVKHYDSNSLWRSSVEMVKMLPQEKRNCLLNCLEASLAICGICNDPPEDAVVSICGHVFCNQCIYERLTGDDNQCPTINCKVRLSISHVFTKATLKSSPFDHGCDSSPGFSVSEVVDAVAPYSKNQPYDSSKIKAALEVLHSLCRPQGIVARNSLKQSTFGDNSEGNSSDSHSEESPKDIPESQNLAVPRSSNDSVKVAGEKAIVFSQWTRMLDLLEACLKNSSIQYRRLDGTMSVVARDKAVKDFNTLPEVSVIIMSLKAASLGLNMVSACHVLLLDLWWNPTTEDQAIDRAHRIGQTRPVTVLRLTVRDTVEDRILALQQKKRKMVASAFGEDGTGGHQTRLTVEDLKYLFMM
ncbi:Helicase-like transcription factor CHR28 [Quillaja saponaria]|uniref:Helicase-like transcription factor CHR28 n=1 Tax=Quillaja saponaria TaxID=32244 RepID=A0AAD7P9R8_QUISA|nr:Helicase-like transcription factor CHR28 [Quillaja saponaria]